MPLIFPEESGILSLDAGLDLQEHDGKAEPWQRDDNLTGRGGGTVAGVDLEAEVVVTA